MYVYLSGHFHFRKADCSEQFDNKRDNMGSAGFFLVLVKDRRAVTYVPLGCVALSPCRTEVLFFS